MYTSFWKLDKRQAEYLQEYMCSPCYNDQIAHVYHESEFWANLSANTFTAINQNVVLLHSGHAFVEAAVTESVSVFQKISNTLLNIISKRDSLLRLIQRISSLAGTCARKVEYLSMRRKSREALGRLVGLEHIQSDQWALPSIMEGPITYNESKVYDSIENLLLFNKHFDRERLQPTFLEIGAGAGLTSLLLLEHISNSKVIICDLPGTICVAYTLLAHFVEDKYEILLPHEINREVLRMRLFDLAFITPNQSDLIDDESIDGIINVHSMQEMEMDTVKAYFRLIERVWRKGAIFLCKNLDRSMQFTDNKIDDYPWDSLGTTVFDGIAEYANHVYIKGDRTIRVKIVKS